MPTSLDARRDGLLAYGHRSGNECARDLLVRRGLLPATSGAGSQEEDMDTEMDMDMDEHTSPDAILDLGMGFWASKALLSAVELGLFTTLARGPLTGQA